MRLHYHRPLYNTLRCSLPTFPLIAGRAFSMSTPTAPNGDLQSMKNQSNDAALKARLLEEGIDSGNCKPGNYNPILRPRAKVDVKGYSGKDNHQQNKPVRKITEIDTKLTPLCKELIAYFAGRKISDGTLRRNGVMQRICSDNQTAIAFAYRRDGELVNCKYRDMKKRIWQEKDTERIFYGLHDIKDASDIIIVEGEMDKLSMEEAGFRNCVSVPDGAPSKVSSKKIPSEEEDTKYGYLWSSKEYLNKASRIILATDADKPGRSLAEELARRLGKERCWRVNWPKKSDTEVWKDANEVLRYVGPDALKDVIDNAEPYPIPGLFQFKQFFNDIYADYNRNFQSKFGVYTGWRNVDDLYPVVPGEISIITGVPNSEKSEWINALLFSINEKTGWKVALCSMENKVRYHARKLLEKHVKKPFFNASYGQSVERMSIEELERGKQWLDETFYVISCADDSLPSMERVLNLAKAAVIRHGIHGLVIDPYNDALNHQLPSNQNEIEYVSRMLTEIKKFAQDHSCHVWFVAHPSQWSGDPPNIYDISVSAHFINKCDNGIVIHQNRAPAKGPLHHVQGISSLEE